MFEGGWGNDVGRNGWVNGDIKVVGWDEMFAVVEEVARGVLGIMRVGDEGEGMKRLRVD